MHGPGVTRRQVLTGSGGLVAAGALAALLPRIAAGAAKPITVGFIYWGQRTTTAGTSRTRWRPRRSPRSRA